MYKRLLAALLAVMLCLGLAACDNGDDQPESTGSSENTGGSVEKYTDFGGYDFVLGAWYDEFLEQTFPSSWHEFVHEYQQNVAKEYNFNYGRVNIVEDGDYTQMVPAKIMAGDKDVSMYYFFEGYIVPCISQNLLWDLTELDSFDPEDPKWDKIGMETFTFNGGIYAVEAAARTPLMGMFYNKRLLEEAGFDPDLPYDLQASGEWTWAKLEEMMRVITRDTNKDGLTDIWGMASTYGNLALSAVWSNEAAFVKRDETGKFIDGTTDAAFLESMEWLQKLSRDGLLFVYNKGGAQGNSFDAFQKGTVAFYPYNFWLSKEPTMVNCVDEWGFVYMPYGPSAGGITMNAQSYGFGIPKTYSKEEAEKIFQMFDLITDLTVNGVDNDWTVEGADEYQDTFWMDHIGNTVNDGRAVTETLYNMMFSDKGTLDYVRMIPGYNYTHLPTDILTLTTSAAEKIQQMRPMFQAAIDSANRLLGYE